MEYFGFQALKLISMYYKHMVQILQLCEYISD